MRVAIILNASWNIVNFRMGLLRNLEKAGHEIVAIAPRDDFSEAIPFEFYELPMQAKGMNPLNEASLLSNMIRIFRKARPDMILTFTPKPNIYGSLAAWWLGIPSIANVAGLGTMFTGGRAARLLMEMLYRIAFWKASWVFFQNEEDKAYFLSKRIVRPERSARIYGSGVDLERFVPRPQNPRPETVFLLVSRLLREKGVGDYVEAARRLRNAGVPARFRIVGIFDEDNPKAITRAEMEAWVREGAVEFLGASRDVRDPMSDADCVVLPSSYREGVPRVLIEAAALGRPLVAYANVGVGDIVETGRNGFLVPSRNVEALAEALTRMARMSPEERSMLCLESRRIAEERFDEQRIAQEYVWAIKNVIGGAHK